VVGAALILGIVGTTIGMVWAFREKSRADSEAESARLAALAETEAKLVAQTNEQRAVAEAERAERELARATEIKRLITEMLTSVSPEHAQGADTKLLKGILDDAAGRLASGEITDELVAADLHSVIGSVYSRLGLYDEAARHLPVAVEPLQRLLGPDHRLTLWAKTELAALFGAQSRYSDAEAIFADNLDRSKRVMGENAPFTLITMNNLADTYRSLGRYDDAERMLLTMQAIQKRTPGADLTLGLMTLGNLYIGMSRYAKAEVAYLELIKQLQKCVGGKHPETIGAMQNLAITYSHRNRFDEAAAIYEDALPLARRVLGPAHGTTVRILINLGFVQFRQGQLQDADEHLTEAMQHCRDLFGDEPHQLTFETMSVLVGLRAKQGRIAEAEALFEEIIDGRTTLYGLKHKDTLASMTNYGYFLNDQGRHHEALKMLEATVPLKREVLGPDHHFTHIAMRGLARTYEALDRPPDAIPLLDELLDYSVRTVDQTDAGMLNNTAWTLLTHEIEELRDAQRALPLAQRAGTLEEADGGANLWMYLDTLALAQHRTGDTTTAIETQKRAISLLPADADATAVKEMKARLAEFEAALGKTEESATVETDTEPDHSRD
jgi:tetratricopeptide (TPR) repeat protein